MSKFFITIDPKIDHPTWNVIGIKGIDYDAQFYHLGFRWKGKGKGKGKEIDLNIKKRKKVPSYMRPTRNKKLPPSNYSRMVTKLATISFSHLILHAHSNGKSCVMLDNKKLFSTVLTNAINKFILAPRKRKKATGYEKITRVDILACSLGTGSYGFNFRNKLAKFQNGVKPDVYTPKYPVTLMNGVLCLEKEFRGYDATFNSLKKGDIVQGSLMSSEEKYEKVIKNLLRFKKN